MKMCNFGGASLDDNTMVCVLQTVVGNPQDPLQQLILYFGAVAFAVIMIFFLFSLMSLIGKILRP